MKLDVTRQFAGQDGSLDAAPTLRSVIVNVLLDAFGEADTTPAGALAFRLAAKVVHSDTVELTAIEVDLIVGAARVVGSPLRLEG